jgi:hypothetical protein
LTDLLTNNQKSAGETICFTFGIAIKRCVLKSREKKARIDSKIYLFKSFLERIKTF